MFAIGKLCLQPRVDHFLCHGYPSDVAPLIARLNSALLDSAAQTVNQPAHHQFASLGPGA